MKHLISYDYEEIKKAKCALSSFLEYRGYHITCNAMKTYIK